MATLDTLQTAVNELTASTTTLLDEVNINKSTLTASATSAAGSASAAAGSASTATTQASNASNSATAASNSAAQATAAAIGAEQIVLGVASNYPDISPSLSLDFANTEALDPRITFARASTARAYDGKTVAKAEENLLLRSEEFDNAAWTKSNATVTANSIAAPNGTTTADLITENSATATHNIFPANPALAGNGLPVTFSIYLYAGTQQYLQIILGTGGVSYFGIIVDTVNWTIPTTGAIGTATYISSSITSVGGDWYRVVITGTNPSGTNSTPQIYGSDNTTLSYNNKTSAGSLTWYLWGAQLEQRSAVTAYTPTTTQPITNYVPVLLSAANNVARFDHNPVTGESLGLLIEEQRTNLVLRSEEFDNASWGKDAATVEANTVVAPDGTLTADKVIADSGATLNLSLITQTITAAAAAYTYSIYAKLGEYNRTQLSVRDNVSPGNNTSVTFSLVDGSITTAAATAGSFSGASATSTNVGNGWYRLRLTFTSTGATSLRTRIFAADSVATTGNGYSGIYIWGAQLEAGAFPTSYIPTTTAQVTRSADAASMTGANFSSWYRADEGTLYAESSLNGRQSDLFAASLGLGNAIFFSPTIATTARLRVRNQGVDQALITASIVNVVGGSAKQCGAYKTDDFAFSANGSVVGTDTLGTVPVVDRLYIGFESLNNVYCNTTIRKLAFYPKRIANSELVALTQN